MVRRGIDRRSIAGLSAFVTRVFGLTLRVEADLCASICGRCLAGSALSRSGVDGVKRFQAEEEIQPGSPTRRVWSLLRLKRGHSRCFFQLDAVCACFICLCVYVGSVPLEVYVRC